MKQSGRIEFQAEEGASAKALGFFSFSMSVDSCCRWGIVASKADQGCAHGILPVRETDRTKGSNTAQSFIDPPAEGHFISFQFENLDGFLYMWGEVVQQ